MFVFDEGHQQDVGVAPRNENATAGVMLRVRGLEVLRPAWVEPDLARL